MKAKGKALLALIGVVLVALATLIQMIVDWYQSYAYGIPMSNVVKALVIAAGVLTLIALVISIKAGGKGGGLR